jgi:hypothetical protein
VEGTKPRSTRSRIIHLGNLVNKNPISFPERNDRKRRNTSSITLPNSLHLKVAVVAVSGRSDVRANVGSARTILTGHGDVDVSSRGVDSVSVVDDERLDVRVGRDDDGLGGSGLDGCVENSVDLSDDLSAVDFIVDFGALGLGELVVGSGLGSGALQDVGVSSGLLNVRLAWV